MHAKPSKANKLIAQAGISLFERQRKQAFPANRANPSETPPRATLGWPLFLPT